MSEEKRAEFNNKMTIRIAVSAILIAVGVVLSYLNPFGYIMIAGTRINPFAHLINALTGVLLGLSFSIISALGIAIIRFSTNIGTIHAFHGGISGAFVVGVVSYFLNKKYPKYVEYAAFTEPVGTVFIGGTITALIEGFTLANLLFYWWVFMLASVVGSVLGFIVLKILKDSGFSRKTFSD
ncbi:MAG: energy coupling factor transporter S component ThiW [Candidatus Lokiarchaeota archaeon]|nr:energy coupling factor transporter S component ThiW [Candidatus Lokiarchaeota archaeon]